MGPVKSLSPKKESGQVSQQGQCHGPAFLGLPSEHGDGGVLGSPRNGCWSCAVLARTANYTGLICKADDDGIACHASSRNSQQCAIRHRRASDEGFVGRDSAIKVTDREDESLRRPVRTAADNHGHSQNRRDFNRVGDEQVGGNYRICRVPAVVVIKKNNRS